ncbi:hypothetical protein PspLS_09433 [Pyricularia sp. CBS 133598]|nr:hypothetical protein PspLS_09433 [Pyricularia sp. CBS 133598]
MRYSTVAIALSAVFSAAPGSANPIAYGDDPSSGAVLAARASGISGAPLDISTGAALGSPSGSRPGSPSGSRPGSPSGSRPGSPLSEPEAKTQTLNAGFITGQSQEPRRIDYKYTRPKVQFKDARCNAPDSQMYSFPVYDNKASRFTYYHKDLPASSELNKETPIRGVSVKTVKGEAVFCAVMIYENVLGIKEPMGQGQLKMCV